MLDRDKSAEPALVLHAPVPSPDAAVFIPQSKEVMRITADGELIIAPHVHPKEAAQALHEAWLQIRADHGKPLTP